MEQHDELQYEKRPRAGLIPWMRNSDGVLEFLMMVSSNAMFGGPRPMISKGKIEDGENSFECAVREAEEELGMRRDNMVGEPEFLVNDRVVLRSGTYDLTLYSVAIQSRWDFEKWCDETEYTVWHTVESFKLEGRRDHIKYLSMLEDKLNQKL